MIKNNKQIHISIGANRFTSCWQNSEMMWSDFVEKIQVPIYGSETLEEYLKLPKKEQDERKDVGGFVGGALLTKERKANGVTGRDLVTLDLDNIPAGGTTDIKKRVGGLGCAAAIYSTRKHAEYAPRLRVIIPLDRTITADEYEPIARMMAKIIGIGYCDRTTFQPSRLMYWPSTCKDAEYVHQVYDAGFCTADSILAMYGDWKDIAQWPVCPDEATIERRNVAKQENPLEKKGVIGAFCRTYSIPEAMEKFIGGMYEPTDKEDRYTYTGGSTTGGAILYEGGLFLFSHHATDPCGGQLVNAFDMIRLHMYGDKDIDAKAGTPVNKLPSFVAMSKLALSDDAVSSLVNKERLEKAREVFADGGEITPDDDVDLSWMNKLSKDGNGNLQKTINNVMLILEHDPLLKGKIVIDDFASRGVILGATPWNKSDEKRVWVNADDAGLYWYLETFYRITGKDKIDAAVLRHGDSHRINDVKRYLTSLKWDGTKRLDTMLRDYLGADDTVYTRAVACKIMVAAVARGCVGGVKFDYMPILTGPQGLGKSTFLSKLGREWFSDSLTTFEGKDAAELIQGTWINEIGELTAMGRQETNAVKQFLSKTHDIYRAAYGRRAERYARHCVFIGTSNSDEFLKDTTGNRRFWPVDAGVYTPSKSVFEDLDEEVDQIWAEAYMRYQLGEKLFMDKETEELAKAQQDSHRELSGKEGVIREFLERPVPKDWPTRGIGERKMFLNGMTHGDAELVPRDKVCAAEVWAECFGKDISWMKRSDSNEIIGILSAIPGWERMKSTGRFGEYGVQKGFQKLP